MDISHYIARAAATQTTPGGWRVIPVPEGREVPCTEPVAGLVRAAVDAAARAGVAVAVLDPGVVITGTAVDFDVVEDPIERVAVPLVYLAPGFRITSATVADLVGAVGHALVWANGRDHAFRAAEIGRIHGVVTAESRDVLVVGEVAAWDAVRSALSEHWTTNLDAARDRKVAALRELEIRGPMTGGMVVDLSGFGVSGNGAPN